MSIAESPATTAADLLDRDDSKSFELVNGELQEVRMSGESSHIAALLIIYLGQVVLRDDLGQVFGSDCGFQCFAESTGDPDRVRRPDVAFVARGRLTQGQYERGFIPVAPDLAVEVVSPNDRASELNSKVDDYLEAGVREVWVLYPMTKTIHILSVGGSSKRISEPDMLSSPDIVPGFECPVADLFPQVSGGEA